MTSFFRLPHNVAHRFATVLVCLSGRCVYFISAESGNKLFVSGNYCNEKLPYCPKLTEVALVGHFKVFQTSLQLLRWANIQHRNTEKQLLWQTGAHFQGHVAHRNTVGYKSTFLAI